MASKESTIVFIRVRNSPMECSPFHVSFPALDVHEHNQQLLTELPQIRTTEAKLAVIDLDMPMLHMLDFIHPCLHLLV